MKKKLRFLFYYILIAFSNCNIDAATVNIKTYTNPFVMINDNNDFLLDSITVFKDSILVYCTYLNDGNDWVNINSDMYIESINTGKKKKIIESVGIPLSPHKLSLYSVDKKNVKLVFPYLEGSRFNIIEHDNNESFNFRGINLFEHSDVSSGNLLNKRIDSLYSKALLICNNYRNDIHDNGDSLFIVKQVQDYARGLQHLGDNEKSIVIFNKSLELLKGNEDFNSMSLMASSYSGLSMSFAEQGQLDMAIDYGRKTLETRRALLTADNYWLNLAIFNLSFIYNQANNSNEALHLAVEFLDNCIRYNNEDLMQLKDKMETFYLSHFSSTRLLLNHMKETLGNLSDTYYYYLRSWPYKLYYSGRIAEALSASEELLSIAKSKFGTNTKDYWIVLSNLLVFYGETGETNRAAVIFSQLENIIEHYSSQMDDETMVAIYNNMSLNLSCQDEYCKNNFLENAIGLLSKTKKRNDTYIALLNNMSLLCYENGKNEEAANLCDSVLCLLKDRRNNAEQQLEYAYALRNRAIMTNDYLTSIDWYKKSYSQFMEVQNYDQALDITENIINKYIAYTLDKYVDVYEENSKIDRESIKEKIESAFNDTHPLDSIVFYYNLHNNLCIDIKKDFKYLSKEMKRAYRNKVCSFNDRNGLFLGLYWGFDMEDYESSTFKYYKNIGLLECCLNGQLIGNGYNLHLDTEYDNISWQDIQMSLAEDEIALFFTPCVGINDTLCIVSVINKQFKAPIIIKLCDYSDLIEAYQNYDLSLVYDLVWGNINDLFESKKHIYFSAKGLFSHIPIENALNNNTVISDVYDIHRLSSLKELYKRRYNDDSKGQYSNILLVGDLNYDYDNNNNDTKNYNKKNNNTNKDYSLLRGISSDIMCRGGFDLLPNTLAEINEISSICNEHNIHVNTIKGNQCTEEFLSNELKSKAYSILHFATHGSYVNKTDIDEKISKFSLNFLRAQESEDIPVEPDPLNRSFLVLSGGNMMCHRKEIPNFNNDGILTAAEVAEIPLEKAELVVLSACQSGLGDSTNEGVMGLQYGLKQAGVKSILMTLDSVDDSVTRLLMAEFYRNLLSGKTKQDALREAQKYIRTIDNGKYNNPNYWASFILLDALN